MKTLAVHVRPKPVKRKKRPEPPPVRPLSAGQLRHAHPDLSTQVLEVSPAAAISFAPTVRTRSHSLGSFLLVLVALGALLLGAAAAPAWRIQRQLHLAPLARVLDRHQLDLALGGGVILFATLALYLVIAIQH